MRAGQAPNGRDATAIVTMRTAPAPATLDA